MVNLDWRVESRAGVSLVTLVVENPTPTPRRVRVANRLDGPIRPPRREGVPEAGWDDGGFEGVVAAGATRALGYACPAPPAEPPAELVWTERAGETERAGKTEDRDGGPVASEATPEGVVRALGTARPPADAVPASLPEPRSASAIPDAVASWLTAVEERAADDDGDGDELTADDSAALDAVAHRIEALRSRESEPSPADSGRSP
ncbi:DUF7857 domain-containing protein [Halorussus litoreus]|uniref:DUF7857 domain-containing protein n=1 Tax=Halorussus litoreus TaxID=1710536 RepID=UPI000E277D22|nr:hypothetical protein [Halorussus litoreus]